MVAKKKSGSDVASASDAWLFLEHFTKYGSMAADTKGQQELKAPLSTVVTFFVLKFAQVSCPLLKTVFLNKRKEEGSVGGGVSSIEEDSTTISLKIDTTVQDDRVFVSTGPVFSHPELKGLSGSFSCQLPAVYLPDQRLWITGLCSVMRYVLLNFGNDAAKKLLGHNQTTLSAPAEVSVWTKFCEIDLPQATSRLLSDLVEAKKEISAAAVTSSEIGSSRDNILLKSKIIQLPEELAKYEAHLRQPIRMHNIRKRMQAENFTSSVDGGDPIIEFARSQHIFAEGPDCLLSDAVLFIHYYIMERECKGVNGSKSLDDLFSDHLPLTCQWFHRVLERMSSVATSILVVRPASRDTDNADNSSSNSYHQICNDLKGLDLTDEHRQRLKRFELDLPEVKNQSLYVSDPARVNPASRSFTRPGVIDAAMKWFESSGIEKLDSTSGPTVFDLDGAKRLNWEEMPALVHPLHGGKLPPERAEKKCHQLENIALAVIDLVNRRGDGEDVTVVDFCSGGGHLAILLAHLLPKSTFILVENKAESLQRAVERTQKLGLTNCHFFQGNLDYFTGSFDIGVSVHACGVATDLVLKMCLDNRADFVSCPCCYGKVQENHVLSYPRSQMFAAKEPTFENYVVLGHTADQTHFTNDKHQQGTWAMDIIDTDRLQMAFEAGYKRILLTKLHPIECTPKNNLLIGQFS